MTAFRLPMRRLASTVLGLMVGVLPAVAQEPVPPPTSPAPSPDARPSPNTQAPTANVSEAASKAPPSPRPRGWDDRRRTVRSYPENLWYNLYGVLTPGNRVPLLVGAGVTGGAFLLDDPFADYFERHHYTSFGNVGETVGGAVAVAGLAVGTFSAGRIARGGRFRAATYDLSQGIIVNGVWTFAVKFAVRRERPDHSDRQSFFSGHSSNAFTAATVMARHYGPKVGVPAYALASLIAVSRMAKHAHYFSDVVAGGSFGFGVGRLVVRRNSRPPTALGDPTPPVPARRSDVALFPDSGPSGDGVGLGLSIRF
jgi:membrane-associated phospholipid phosphatase